MKPKMYFGHPINTYGTELEERLIEIILNAFPQYEIENPNQKCHQEGYKHWKETTSNGMNYFYKIVLPDCAVGIFLAFRDSKWGAGVFGEAQFISKLGRPIYEITAEGLISTLDLIGIQPLTVEETIKRISITTDEATNACEIVPY